MPGAPSPTAATPTGGRGTSLSSRGRFNFDEIRFEYFRDSASLFEAFKAGEIDLRPEDDPGRWIEGYGFARRPGRARHQARVRQRACPRACRRSSSTRAGPCSRTPRVRRAFILLFDAEWINRSLFDGAYKRTQSFFERSDLSSHGRPAARANARCWPPSRQLRQARGARRHLRASPSPTAAATDRANLRAALKLLTEAGYELEGRPPHSRAASRSPSSSWPRPASRSG